MMSAIHEKMLSRPANGECGHVYESNRRRPTGNQLSEKRDIYCIFRAYLHHSTAHRRFYSCNRSSHPDNRNAPPKDACKITASFGYIFNKTKEIFVFLLHAIPGLERGVA
jgi:hypothetical protein